MYFICFTQCNAVLDFLNVCNMLILNMSQIKYHTMNIQYIACCTTLLHFWQGLCYFVNYRGKGRPQYYFYFCSHWVIASRLFYISTISLVKHSEQLDYLLQIKHWWHIVCIQDPAKHGSLYRTHLQYFNGWAATLNVYKEYFWPLNYIVISSIMSNGKPMIFSLFN